MKISRIIYKINSFDFSSILGGKNFKQNRHYEINLKSTKDKFKSIKEIKETKSKKEEEPIQDHKEFKEKNAYEIDDEKTIDPKIKYKAFSYNFPNEESKKRFEDYNDYSKFLRAMNMNQNSIFKIKNFFVRRNFLKSRMEEKKEEENEEIIINASEKFEALEKMIDPFKEKILLYETNNNIIDLIGSERKVIKWCLFSTCLNNIYILTSFKYLFVNTFTSYLFTYYFNICVYAFFLCYKKMADDCVLQAEYIPKTKELLILKRNAYNYKIYEEKVNISDLKYFKSNRIYEKNSKYFENIKSKKLYAFHENGIWHQEKVLDFIFDLKKDKNSNLFKI